jgi:pyrimidine-nucleoside phosphorylase
MGIAAIKEGNALEKFKALVQAQGGDAGYVDDPEKLPKAPIIETVNAPRSGYLSGVHARIVGETAVTLGAGRAKKGDPIDHAVGIVVHRKVGDQLKQGEPLFTIHANGQALFEQARERLLAAHTFSDEKVEPLPLFYGVVS